MASSLNTVGLLVDFFFVVFFFLEYSFRVSYSLYILALKPGLTHKLPEFNMVSSL